MKTLVALCGLLLAPVARADAAFRDIKVRQAEAGIPADLDLAPARAGRCVRATYTPLTPDGKVPMNRFHDWQIDLTALCGAAPATAAITAAMPQHLHGLAVSPRVELAGPTRIVIHGLRFHMPGWWKLSLTVQSGEVEDVLRFDLVI